MERLFTCLSSDSGRLHDTLSRVQDDWEPLFGGPIRGWGFGYRQESQTLLRKRPTASLDHFDVGSIAHDLHTRSWMVQLLSPQESSRKTPDVPPFRFRNWMGSVVGDFEGLDVRELRSRLPSSLTSNIQGASVEEVIVHMALDALQRFGATPQRPRVPTKSVLNACAHTLRSLQPNHASPRPLALVITHGRSVVVGSTGDIPVHIWGFDDLPNPDQERVTLRDRERALRAAFVSVGADLSESCWERLKTGEIFAVDAEWEIRRDTIDALLDEKGS